MAIIYKTVIISGKRWQYWSDDNGLSWYWIGSRNPSKGI